MKILFSYITAIGRSFIRNIYWFYKALNIKTGKKLTLHFPLIVEGQGKIEVGNNIQIGSRVHLGVEANSFLQLGSRIKIEHQVKISVSSNSRLTIGNGSFILAHTLCYSHKDWHIGEQVGIASHCQIFSRESGYAGELRVGDGSNIGDYSLLDISDNLTIGKSVAIGARCTIYTHDHNYKEESITAPWKGKPLVKPVIIEDGAWIGSNVTILPGTTIGKNSIVAAGSVVTKDIPPSCLYGGVPAKLIKQL